MDPCHEPQADIAIGPDDDRRMDHLVQAPVLSAVVMTHPARGRAAESLIRHHAELGLRVAADPDPGGPSSPLRTARVAWGMASEGATHHLVLQDDTELCDGFTGAVHAAIAARPGEAVCLFAEWGSRTSHVCRLAALAEADWAEVADEYVPSQALVLPTAVARGFAEFASHAESLGERNDDVALAGFLRAESVPVHVPVPNLADHVPVASLADHDIMGVRRSVCFAGALSPIPGCWPGSAVSGLPVVPHFSWWEGRSVCCLRDQAAPGGWRKVATMDVLSERGISARSLRQRFDQAVTDADTAAGLGPGTGVRTLVSSILLFQLWLTGFVLGLVVTTPGMRDPGAASISLAQVRGRLGDPVTRRALATMAPGALRRFVPEPKLAMVARLLEPMIGTAVCDGAARG